MKKFKRWLNLSLAGLMFLILFSTFTPQGYSVSDPACDDGYYDCLFFRCSGLDGYEYQCCRAECIEERYQCYEGQRLEYHTN